MNAIAQVLVVCGFAGALVTLVVIYAALRISARPTPAPGE